jgi:parvulin-like peptidyl-prolyl isomerase
MLLKQFVLIFVSCISLTLGQGKDLPGSIIASVGNYNISLADFSTRYAGFLSSSGVKDNAEVRKSILNNMIFEILLKNYDSNESVLNNPGYLKDVNQAKKQVVLDFLKDREIYAKLSATDKEIRDTFEKMNKRILARHLYADTEEKANYLYELLMMGVDFDNLAAQVFTDSTLRNNGGSVGYFTWGDMDPAFEEAAYSLQKGQISRPVKTAQGYSIIRVDDIVVNPIVTETQFQQKKSQVERAIKIYKKQPAERKYIDNLVNTGNIKFNEIALQELLKDILAVQKNEIPSLVSTSAEECAGYNNISYNSSLVIARINELPENYIQRITNISSLKAVITGFIIQDKLMQHALDKGYDKNEEVLAVSSKMQSNLFFKYKKEEVISTTGISEDEVKNFYQKNIDLFSKEKEINVKEIMVDRETLADSIYNMLKNGEDFASLAKKYSLRDWSAKNGGEMGYTPASRFGMLKERFWNAKAGEIIGPVQIENFYGIFTVTGKEEGKPIEFSLVKSEAKKMLLEEQSKNILQNYADGLKRKVKIEINDKLLYSSLVNG